MAIIDVHTHIYPAKIADKATLAVGNFYEVGMFGMTIQEQDVRQIEASTGEEPAEGEVPRSGTVEQLLEVTQGCPITHHVVHSVATKPTQVESIDNFIIAECAAHPNFIGFACMHQDYPDPETELARVKAAGLIGVKIHPDLQKVNLDDDRLMRVYEICERLDLAVLLHTGDYRFDYSHPRRLVGVLHTFPHLRVDAAHMGGWSIYDIGYDYLKDERCWVDASSTFEIAGIRHARELVEMYGTDRVMFGSDFPMTGPAQVLEQFKSMGFSKAENERMWWHNTEAFLERDITD